MRSLSVTALSVRAFRNFLALDLTLGPRFNVFAGDNGQGKTNLLEAIYVALTSKSFRTSKQQELVSYDERAPRDDANGNVTASVRATIDEDGQKRVQIVGLGRGQRLVRIDGKRPPSLAEFAVQSPVVVFHPGEMELSMGGSAERRKLLDRVALYMAPVSREANDRYTQAMRSRQRTLEMRGTHAADLADWEALMAQHGAALMAHRRRAAERIAEHAEEVFRSIGTPGLPLVLRYAPGASEDEAALARELEEMRAADLRRGSANRGPHRDDLSLDLGGHVARSSASQGQHRAIVLSLKAAEIETIGKTRGVRPVLLLDDVSSELDRERTAALFSFLREQRGQVLLTTTRPELIDIATPGERVDYRVCAGALEAPPSR